VECIQQGKQPSLTGEDGRAVLEVIFAAYESARTGQRVSLPFESDARRPIDLWLGESR
jgi:predicted dehydrogenase